MISRSAMFYGVDEGSGDGHQPRPRTPIQPHGGQSDAAMSSPVPPGSPVSGLCSARSSVQTGPAQGSTQLSPRPTRQSWPPGSELKERQSVGSSGSVLYSQPWQQEDLEHAGSAHSAAEQLRSSFSSTANYKQSGEAHTPWQNGVPQQQQQYDQHTRKQQTNNTAQHEVHMQPQQYNEQYEQQGSDQQQRCQQYLAPCLPQQQQHQAYHDQQQQHHQVQQQYHLQQPNYQQQQQHQGHHDQEQQHHPIQQQYHASQPSYPDPQSQQQQQQQQLRSSVQTGAPSSGGSSSEPLEPLNAVGPMLPLEVLLSPLLPSAGEAQLLARLSQLRMALEQHIREAAGWEQQVIGAGVYVTFCNKP